MKNLKKVLALVLALATVMGLGITAGAKEYTDADKIEYTEAVDVMSAIGVLSGNPDGSFAPTKNLTREQAAKMVAYIMNGGKDVNDVYAGANTFTDCKDSWAKGYIAFAQQAGVISGVGKGKFNPKGTLTGVALAKMMLVSLGYDASVEKYQDDNNWALNVISDATDAGLLKGLSASNLYTAITREQASQMMFNALKSTMVKYNSKGTTIDMGNGVIINTGDTSVVPQPANTDSKGEISYTTTGDGKLQLIEKFFPKVTMTTTEDDFGRPGRNWKNDKDPITFVTDTAVATYEGATTEGKVFTDLGYTSSASTVKLTGDVTATLTKGDTTPVFQNGTSIEIYETATDDTYDVVVVATYVKKLTDSDIVAAKAATATADAQPAYIKVEGTPANADAAGAYKTDAYKAGDVILYTKTGSADTLKIQTVEKAQAVVGKMEKYTDSTLTVGGTTYNFAANKDVSVAPASVGFTAEKTFYVDAKNNVYMVGTAGEAAVHVDGYFYVLGTQVQYNAGADSDIINGAAEKNAVVKAKVVDTAGVVSIVDLAVYTENNKLYYNDLTGAKTEITANVDYAAANKWAGYTVANGKYTVTDAANYAANAKLVNAELDKTAKAIDGKYLTSKTTLTVINTADNTVTTTTGYDKMELTASDLFITYAGSDATTIDAIYVVQTESVKATSTANYAYAVESGATVADGTEWTFYINGEAVTYAVKLAKDETYTADALAENTVYDLRIVDGKVTGATLVAAVDSAAATDRVTVVDGTFFVVNGTVKTFATDCKIYNITTGTPGTADMIEVGDYVKVIAEEDGKVSLVYIVDAPAG